jgi:hypothetical protein
MKIKISKTYIVSYWTEEKKNQSAKGVKEACEVSMLTNIENG